MFPLIGIALALYTLAAAVTGRVWAKAGPGGKIVSRAASPEYFWIVILIYAALSLALIFLL
jgi:hypothetical protein